MTERHIAAIERARHTPVEIVEIRRERKCNLSFTKQGLIEFVQRNWADRERERLVSTWGIKSRSCLSRGEQLCH